MVSAAAGRLLALVRVRPELAPSLAPWMLHASDPDLLVVVTGLPRQELAALDRALEDLTPQHDGCGGRHWPGEPCEAPAGPPLGRPWFVTEQAR